MENNNLTVDTKSLVKKIKKKDTLSPTIYSPASVTANINQILVSSKNNKKIWKKSKLSKSK